MIKGDVEKEMSFAYHGKRRHGPVKRAIAISSAVLAIWAGDSASGQVLLDPTLDTFGQQVSFSGSDVDTFARLENLPPNRSVGTIAGR